MKSLALFPPRMQLVWYSIHNDETVFVTTSIFTWLIWIGFIKMFTERFRLNFFFLKCHRKENTIIHCVFKTSTFLTKTNFNWSLQLVTSVSNDPNWTAGQLVKCFFNNSVYCWDLYSLCLDAAHCDQWDVIWFPKRIGGRINKARGQSHWDPTRTVQLQV